MPRQSQKKLAEIGMFTTPATGAYGLVSGAVKKITWKNNINLSPQEGGFGTEGPVAITSNANGATVAMECVNNNDAIKTLKAYLQATAPSSFVSWDPQLQYPAFIYVNEQDPKSLKRYRSLFVAGAMFDGDGQEIAEAPGTRQFNGQALWAREFEGAIVVDRTAGNATPVTTLTPSKTTMLGWTSVGVTKYALCVLRQAADGTITVLDKAAGDYTETATAVTLTTGLGTGEAALLAYVCAPY
jgi:hypothetical protein